MTFSSTLSPSATEKAEDHFPSAPCSPVIEPAPRLNRLARWTRRLEFFSGFEARGIARVPPSERYEETTVGYIWMVLLWLGANIAPNNLAIGLLGPLVFHLGFVDSALCATLGVIVGCIPPSYISTWGSVSGSRTLVRFWRGVFDEMV